MTALRKSTMRRLPILLAALVPLLIATTVLGAPSAAAHSRVQQPKCIPVGERCIPFDEITENTEIYVDWRADQTVQGFTNFNSYAQWLRSEYGVTARLENGRVVFDFTPGGPEGSTPLALWATFYSRGDFTGTAFVLNPPNAFNDLRNISYPGGGNWNNRISSVVTVQGAAGGAGAALCAKVGFATPGWVLVVSNQTRLQLLGGFNNSASFVGVFAG